ncbi:MAG: quinolinate synthase [Bacteroidetes bacterium GWE2_41_25]|nr:MAG: quinolinate synthase [Bacteroidetes bacterium GWE2_41_25]OFY58845.1 MAG: quinolinate synthase [Bacteroidetes bacterium GWF2_41_9]HBH84021.1 quinolinate synthase [Bacteroidales bacterium]
MMHSKTEFYIEGIKRLRAEKNAIILAHYYQTGDIQDIADFVGDSLSLSQKAASNSADIILFAGVKFMAETAKILAPEKKVLLPDMNAGCSLADSCKPEEFKKFIDDNPGRTVVTYVNTTADIKALSDIICTSSNAVKIVESLPPDEKIIFAPDRNLGNYVLNITGRDIVIWNGTCHVHEEFSLEAIIRLKKENHGAKIIVHPECELPVRMVADYIGSTSSLLQYTKTDRAKSYIVATEAGIIHQMQKENPQKKFIPAPPRDSTCGCSECSFMKLITLEKIYNSLDKETPEIFIDSEILLKAQKPIRRMMDISKKLGL